MCIFTCFTKIEDLISFGTTYWFILLLAIIVAAAGVVILLYVKNKANNALSKTQIRILMGLRFLSFFTIAFLLLSPFLRNLKKIVQNPIIIAAYDNSSSLTSGVDSVKIAEDFREAQADISNKLGADFEIIEYTFGENTNNLTEIGFNEKESNYSDLISTINNNHFNQNIGAVILAGDGIYNQGKNPLSHLDEINFPIYTLAFGDTSIVFDSRIQNIRVNRTAFSGNKFPVEIDVQFLKLKGKSLKLSIVHKGTTIESTIITPPNNNFFTSKSFILEAGEAGLKHFSANIEVVQNEQNTSNNKAGFVINVLENKQKILIISDGSHPDIGAIKSTLEDQMTYEVSVFTEEPYPANLKDFNLLILNQLPSTSKSAAKILETAKNSRLPVLFIVGNKTFLPQFNTLNQGANIEALAGNGEQAQSTYNSAYATFNLSEEFIEIVPKLPPLQVAFADYSLDANFTPLLYQKIKNIETAKPLIATGKLNGRKVGYIFGEGIWRWRLFDYYQNQNHTRYNEFVNQLIQYLALRENEDNFIIDFKPVYTETDNVIFNAELYNDAFERIASEEINIVLKNSKDEEFNFTFDVQGSNYYLNAGNLPMGDYSFVAETNIGNDKYTETGSFTILQVNIENLVNRANHTLLYQLSQQSGGKFYLANQASELISDLKSESKPRSTSYYQEMINDFLNLRWLFFVLLFLLSVEWFLRKYWGIY